MFYFIAGKKDMIGKIPTPASKPVTATDQMRIAQCPFCKKIFASQSHLRIHQVVHTGETPWHCEYCDRRFNTKGSLQRHKKTIHGVYEGSGSGNKREFGNWI